MTDRQKIEALRDALREAVDAVIDELHAAGADEVERHPVLRAHCQIAAKGQEVLKATRPTR